MKDVFVDQPYEEAKRNTSYDKNRNSTTATPSNTTNKSQNNSSAKLSKTEEAVLWDKLTAQGNIMAKQKLEAYSDVKKPEDCYDIKQYLQEMPNFESKEKRFEYFLIFFNFFKFI